MSGFTASHLFVEPVRWAWRWLWSADWSCSLPELKTSCCTETHGRLKALSLQLSKDETQRHRGVKNLEFLFVSNFNSVLCLHGHKTYNVQWWKTRDGKYCINIKKHLTTTTFNSCFIWMKNKMQSFRYSDTMRVHNEVKIIKLCCYYILGKNNHIYQEHVSLWGTMTGWLMMLSSLFMTSLEWIWHIWASINEALTVLQRPTGFYWLDESQHHLQ